MQNLAVELNLEKTIATYTNCVEPNYGNVNPDGYVRVLDKPRKEGGKLVMNHRLKWEEANGPIPKGHEINHKCKNRKCYNVDHLECLPTKEHRALDNSLRYKRRAECVMAHVLAYPKISQTKIGKLFGITQSGVSGIIARNKKENTCQA